MRARSTVLRPVLLSFPIACLSVLPLAAQDASPKSPPPSQEILDMTQRLIHNVFKAEFAKTDRADRLELSRRLFDAGFEANALPDDRYAIWRESASVALLAGDAPRAWKSVDEITKIFAVSVWEMKASLLESAAPDAAEDSGKIAQAALAAFEKSNAVDPESAHRLLKIARKSAAQAKEAALLAQIEERAKAFEPTRREIDAGKDALDLLKTTPDDPPVNLKAGIYLCCTRGDWAAGLPLLARGNAAEWKTLATKDLAALGGGVEARTKVELGDGWFDQAKDLSGASKTHVLSRACAWYRDALPMLTGSTKSHVESRLTELAAIPVIPLRAGRRP